MKEKSIEVWEVILLMASTLIVGGFFLIELKYPSSLSDVPLISSTVTGIFTGFIATIFVLFADRFHKRRQLARSYKDIAGKYKRIDMAEDYRKPEELINMKVQNIDLEITLTYNGGHTFLIEANYWKTNNALVKGVIEFNPIIKTSASGNYRYTRGLDLKGHLGTYNLEWDYEKKELIVFYKHLFPRNIQYDPDNNRGWEIWKKVN